MTDLSQDPRWRRFNQRGFECPCCGQSFDGVYDVVFDHPDCWPHGNREKSGEKVLAAGEDRLSGDLCQFEEHRFIRCVMPFNILGSDQEFCFGVWGSAAQASFDAYVAAWEADDYSDFEGCFSWLANDLPDMRTPASVPCNLRIEDPQQRPRLYAHDADNPVSQLQRSGITFDQLLDIYAATGNDIRPHLMDA
ncbi:MAG: DUF2199 domain-containing protein [Alphaproteobacteria bacterium]|nr:DUF2199 domain-containing protein [Alphaproteobacteria bacterium]